MPPSLCPSSSPSRSRSPAAPSTALPAALLAALLVALLAPFAAAVVPASVARAGPVPARPGHLRVAAYNVHAGAGEDGVFDLDRTAASIRALHADVIGLEEVDVHWDARSEYRDVARELARRLHLHVRFAPIYSLDPPAPGEPRREFGVAVLSRLPVLSFRNHQITRLSTQDPDPVPAPAPGFGEAVVLAGRTPVHVYVTHLDYRQDPSVRQDQVRDTLRILGHDPRGAAQILLGDLNAPPDAPELAPLWTRLTDAYAVGGPPPGWTYPAGTPAQRIDDVGVSPALGVRGATVPGTPLARTASDHRPIVADLVVRPGRPGESR